jgi:hypothetical protein
MAKLRLFVLALPLLLSGCHVSRSGDIRFTLTPSTTEDSVKISCEASSSGKCHFAFKGSAEPATVSVDTGTSVTVRRIGPGTQYCAETHRPSLDNCSKSILELHRGTVEKKTSTDRSSS